MEYVALACDYDGTLAHDGKVDEDTLGNLERFSNLGGQLILITGRQLDELKEVFPELLLFQKVVAENGALLYNPVTKEEKLLCDRPSQEFITRLQQKGVTPLSVGRAIVATWQPHYETVRQTIKEFGYPLEVILNKDAVMVLPSGVNKASGLLAALKEMATLPEETVGVGDAENDEAFLSLCGYSVAVANALPSLKERVNFVTQSPRGAGVSELVDLVLTTQLS